MDKFEIKPENNKKQDSLFASLSPESVQTLLLWFARAKRDLPWRRECTPYRVWVSEVMLQQTRVEAVIPYFERFVAELPDIRALAEVSTERLLKLWEGLGYYSRARNLQKAARMIIDQYKGELPASVEALQTLPGIGPYTAGAIASIAFGIPAPAVDGNVMRVLTRMTGCNADIRLPSTVAAATACIRDAIPQEFAGDFTQALMELGALLCIPNGAAKCVQCPWQYECFAAKNACTDRLPVRSGLPKRRMEQRTLLLMEEMSGISEKSSISALPEAAGNGRYLLHRRAEKGLLAGLWEFPSLAGDADEESVRKAAERYGFQVKTVVPLQDAVHVFTHVEWHMHAYLLRGVCTGELPTDTVFATREQMDSVYALPSAFAAYRKQIGVDRTF